MESLQKVSEEVVGQGVRYTVSAAPGLFGPFDVGFPGTVDVTCATPSGGNGTAGECITSLFGVEMSAAIPKNYCPELPDPCPPEEDFTSTFILLIVGGGAASLLFAFMYYL